jgi:hypothetical protein
LYFNHLFGEFNQHLKTIQVNDDDIIQIKSLMSSNYNIVNNLLKFINHILYNRQLKDKEWYIKELSLKDFLEQYHNFSLKEFKNINTYVYYTSVRVKNNIKYILLDAVVFGLLKYSLYKQQFQENIQSLCAKTSEPIKDQQPSQPTKSIEYPSCSTLSNTQVKKLFKPDKPDKQDQSLPNPFIVVNDKEYEQKSKNEALKIVNNKMKCFSKKVKKIFISPSLQEGINKMNSKTNVLSQSCDRVNNNQCGLKCDDDEIEFMTLTREQQTLIDGTQKKQAWGNSSASGGKTKKASKSSKTKPSKTTKSSKTTKPTKPSKTMKSSKTIKPSKTTKIQAL